MNLHSRFRFLSLIFNAFSLALSISLLSGQGKDILEAFLDRADRQTSPENWLAYAEMGREAALAQWERGAEIDAARASIEGTIGAETRDRYREWLVSRFMESVAPADYSLLRDAVARQNDSLLFEHDADGSLCHDANGDPVLKTLADFDGDAAAWKANVGKAIDDSVASWRSSLEGAYPELLTQVPESERQDLQAYCAVYTDLYGSAYRRELAALSLQEERRFVALRSYDQYSLRKKSEEQTAGAITDRLIAETNGATEAGIRKLRESLSAEGGAGPGEARIDAAQWQTSFNRIFEAGLSTWDKAGQRLLAERVEWERQAGKDYSEGEKAWATAYERLHAEEDRWQAELRGLLDTGREAWANKESELEGSIAQASAELEKAIGERESAKSDEVASLVDVFAQSASMVATAKESSAYWLEKLGIVLPEGTQGTIRLVEWGKSRLSSYIAILDGAASDAAKDAKARLTALRDSFSGRELTEADLASLQSDIGLCGIDDDSEQWKTYYQQAAYWQTVESTYVAYASDARSRLQDTFSRVISDDGAAKSLLGITDASVDLSGVYLDEYQVELLKAEALASYWDGQVDIADKVHDYATTISSARPTAAQTEAACESALETYAAARDSYRRLLADLERSGLELGSAKDALAAKRAGLAEANSKLEEAESGYETLQALFKSNNKDFFAQELASYYCSLIQTLDPAQEGSLATTMAAYLAASRAYGYEAKIALDNKQLELLVVGGEQGGAQKAESLESLREKIAGIVIPSGGPELDAANIDPTDRLYAAYEQASWKYSEARNADQNADADMYLHACISIALQYRASLQAKLDEREDAIRLLTSSSAEAWYGAVTNRTVASDAVAAVEKDAKEAAGKYLAARAALEAKAYGALAEAKAAGKTWTTWSYDASKPEELLAYSVSGSVSRAAEKKAALEALSGFLNVHLDLESSRSALYAFISDYDDVAETKDFLRRFLGGSTEFMSTLGSEGSVAIDLAGGLLVDAARERDRALRLPTAIENYAPQSLAFAAALEAEGAAELRSALSSSGLLAAGSGFSLVDPSAAWSLASSMSPAERETWLVSILAAARQAETKLASYRTERLEAYLVDLEDYFAARENCEGAAAVGGAQAMDAELAEIKAELISLGGLKRGSLSMDKRLQGLASLYAWARDSAAAPGAELAAAKDCLVEAGAIETVKRAIAASADSSVSLESASTWDGSFAAVFSTTAASLADMRPRVIARAKELLAINGCLQGSSAAVGAEERKALAYALWKEPSLQVDASGLTISEQGGLIVDLWKFFVDATTGLGGNYSGKAEELAKVDAFLLGLGAVEHDDFLIEILEAVKTGPTAKERIFLDALCPGLAARAVKTQAYKGSGGEAFERAFAIDLASKATGSRGKECYELLLALSGIQSHGTIDDSWIGVSPADSLALALSTLSGTAFDEEARIFWLKSLAVASAAGAAFDASGLSASGLSAAGLAEIGAFAETLDASRLFIRGLGQSELDYALAAGTDGLSGNIKLAAASAGAASDDLFYTADLGTGASPSDFLRSLEMALVGADTSYDGGIATEALSLLESRLDAAIANGNARYSTTSARREIRRAREAALASGDADYRAFLIASNFSGPPGGDPLPRSTEVAAFGLDTAQDILHAKESPALNLALETASCLDADGRALAAAFEETSAAEKAAGAKANEDYCAEMAKFLSGTAPISAWSATRDSYSCVASRNLYEKAAGDLDKKEGEIAGLKSDIARIGEGLSEFSGDKARQNLILAGYREEVEKARIVYDKANGEVEKASDAFGDKMTAYNAVYASSQGSYKLMEKTRQESDVKEAINDFAMSAYLKLDEAASAAYRSPTEELAYAQGKRDRARALVAALTGLYDQTATSRDADTPEILAYRESYRQYIELARLQSQLDRASALQRKAADDAQQAYDAALSQGFAGAPRLGAEYSGKDLGSTGTDAVVDITDLLAYDSTTGIRLNYDSSSFVITQTSSTQYAGLKAYFEGDEDAAGKSYKEQIASLAQFFTGYSGNNEDLMQQWGLAFEHLRNELYTANCEVRSGSTATKDALQKALEGAGVSTDNPAAGLEADGLFTMVATTTAQADLGDYRGRLVASCAAAYASVMGDAKQKKAFDFLVVAALSGLCRTSSFLDLASTLALAKESRGILDGAAASHAQMAGTLTGASAACLASAVALSCIPFVGWIAAAPYYASAVGFGIAAVIETDKGTKAGDARDRMAAYLNESEGLSSKFIDGRFVFLTTERVIGSTRETWVKEKDKLAALKGSMPGGKDLSADEAIASLDKAIQDLKADTAAVLSMDEEKYIRDAFASGKVKASEASSVLAACVSEAKNLKDRQEEALKAAVADDKAKQADAEAAYTSAMNAYLNGDAGASLAAVTAAAKSAFGTGGGAKSAYAVLAYESDMAATYADLSSGKPGGDRLYEKAKAEALAAYATTVKELYAARCAALKASREAEWDLRRLELREKESSWSSMVDVTVGRALTAWKEGVDKLDANYQAWGKSFQDEYQTKDELWSAGYLAFVQKKQVWVDDLALKAGQAGSDEILATADMSAETMSRDLSFVSGMRSTAMEPEAMLNELLGGMKLGDTLTTLGKRNSGIASLGFDPRRGIGIDAGGSASAMALVASFQGSQDEELGTRAMLIVADRARESLVAAKKGYKDMVVQANDGFESSMDDMYLGSAFLKTGGAYLRDAIVDATASGALKEKQRVETYRKFATPDFATRTSLEVGDLRGLGTEAIQALLGKALKELDEKRQAIFGSENTSEAGAGDFGKHIGYAPVFRNNPNPDDLSKPEDMILTNGEGEAGRLVMYFSYFQVKEQKGVAEYGKPSWDRKIWDDRGQWMKAPTPAQVVDVGLSVAAMAIGGGPWVAMAINLADDAAFGMMDVAGGYRRADEALFDFGKKALASVATTTISGAFGGLASTMHSSTFTGVIGKTMLKGTELFSSSLASGAIAGIRYSNNGGWGYDSEVFSDSLFGNDALAGYASGMASTFATGALGLTDLRDANGYALGDKVFDTRSIASFNGVVGSLAGQGMTYAMTGAASFNLLNAADLSGEALHGGLLEMHLGGSEGFSVNLGQNGADLSATMLGESLSGMIDTGKLSGAKIAAIFGAMEGVSTLDSANMLGYANRDELARKLWSGKLKASYSDELVVNSDGSGDYGSWSSADPATIRLSSDLLGLGKEKAALLASVMSHEGAHAGGVHVEAAAMTDQLATYATLLETFRLEGNTDFVKGTFAELMDPAAWMENPEGIDHLTILKNGSWKRDGDNDSINFENGKPSIGVSKPGFQSGIEQFYGLAGGAGYQELLKGLGYTYDDAARKWNGPAIVGKADIEKAYKEGNISKEVRDKVIGQMDSSSAAPSKKNLLEASLALGQTIWQSLASLFSAKKQEKVADRAYGPSDYGATAITTHADAKQHDYPGISWYEDGHPAIDLAGTPGAAVHYPKNLILEGTNDDRRLLYQIDGTQDYVMMTHVGSSDVQALEKLLSQSANGQVVFKAGSSLFAYPSTTDKNSTGPHLHVEMYKQQGDGSYWFADPGTGKTLPGYNFQYSKNGNNYTRWQPLLQSNGFDGWK